MTEIEQWWRVRFAHDSPCLSSIAASRELKISESHDDSNSHTEAHADVHGPTMHTKNECSRKHTFDRDANFNVDLVESNRKLGHFLRNGLRLHEQFGNTLFEIVDPPLRKQIGKHTESHDAELKKQSRLND
jgi:hypothetical protein